MDGLSSPCGPQPFPELPGVLIRIGVLQFRPPSVDLLTRNRAFPFGSPAPPLEYRFPSGSKESHESNALLLVPLVSGVNPGMSAFRHVAPPSRVTLTAL